MVCPRHQFDAGAPQYINPLELDAPELVERLEAKAPRTIGSWREIGAEEYARSFTVAQSAGYDIVRDIYDALLATLQEPDGTERTFAERLIPILREKGWMSGLDDRQLATRLQLIYETNLRTSQAAGRWKRIQRTKLALPYLLGFTAKDERVRHPPKSEADHRAFEGILLPVDHPFWDDYFPPLGFRCRCQVVQRSRSQVARLGIGVTPENELAERRARLGEPWGFNPGRDPLSGAELAAERSNRNRLEGAPPISVQANRGLGADRWNAMMAEVAREAVESLIARIFG